MIDVHVDYVEAELGRHPWFAGDSFTAADVMMSYPLEVARGRAGISRSSHSRIFGWVETIQGRPAYQAALARGGPYAFG
jgi:glutathione S-transferase